LRRRGTHAGDRTAVVRGGGARRAASATADTTHAGPAGRCGCWSRSTAPAMAEARIGKAVPDTMNGKAGGQASLPRLALPSSGAWGWNALHPHGW